MSIEGYGLLLASICSIGVGAAQIMYFKRMTQNGESAICTLSWLVALTFLLVAALLFWMAQGPLQSRMVGLLVGIFFIAASVVSAQYRPFRFRASLPLIVVGAIVLAATQAL
jgi:hypothetical protein